MRVFLTFLTVCWMNFAVAQNQLNFESYTRKQGLSHNEVYCVFQDSRGFIWAGTAFGLNFFNGTSFLHYYHIPSDSNSLPNNKILSIAEDRKQRLWIGTQYGVSCFDLLSNTFTNYTALSVGSEKRNIEFCYAFVSRNNTIWIGTNSGIYCIDPETEESKFFPVELCASDKFCNRFVSDFYEDGKGDIWASTSHGVYKKAKDGLAFEQRMSAPDSYYAACNKIVPDNKGNLYIATWDRNTLCKRMESDSFYPLVKPPYKTGDPGSSFDLMLNNDGTVWIGTLHGIVKTNSAYLQGKPSFHFKELSGTNQPISGVFDILRDKENRIWLATVNGLLKLNKQQEFIKTISYEPSPAWSPICFYQCSKDSLLILNSLALMIYDLKKKSFNTVAGHLSFPYRIVRSGHHYWLSVRPGLLLLDDQFRKKKWFTYTDESHSPVYFNQVLEDKDGLLWLGSSQRKGIYLLDPVSAAWEHPLSGTKDVANLLGWEIYDIKSDKNGDVWIASSPLVRYKKSNKKI